MKIKKLVPLLLFAISASATAETTNLPLLPMSMGSLASIFAMPLPVGSMTDIILLNGVTTNATSAPVWDLSGWNKASVQATSAAGSVCSVAVQIQNTIVDPFATVATIVNPSASEPGYFGNGIGGLRVVLSGYVSGTVTVTLKRLK